MPTDNFLQPTDTIAVSKTDDAVAVGEDLAFQEKWWKFERATWIFFLLVIIADALGAFGQGWLAHTHLRQPGSAMDIKYDHIARETTPTELAVHFNEDAASDGTVRLFVSDSLIDDLGNQRVAPQPLNSAIGQGGVTYTFPYTGHPSSVLFSLEPSKPGVFHFTMAVPGHQPATGRVVVLP